MTCSNIALEQLIEINWRGRQQGKTEAMAKACKNIGATLICHNQEEARRVVNIYGIQAISKNKSIHGNHGPYLVDPQVVGEYAFNMRMKVSNLEKEVKRLTEAFDKREKEIVKYDQLIKLIRTMEHSGKLGVKSCL